MVGAKSPGRSPMEDMHYGDEDPEFKDDTDPEYELELFETAKYLGWTPESMRDKAFAARYAEWLKTAPPEEWLRTAGELSGPTAGTPRPTFPEKIARN